MTHLNPTPPEEEVKQFFKQYAPQLEYLPPCWSHHGDSEDDDEDQFGWYLEKAGIKIKVGKQKLKVISIVPEILGYVWIISLVNTKTRRWHSMYLTILLG